MQVTFYSNYMNHHQLYLSKAFINNGVDYTFIATTKVPKERLDLGYEDMNKKYDFVLTTYDSKENYKRALNLAKDSDIVIIGSAPDEFIKERQKQNKIIFRYSERIFKRGRTSIKSIKTIIGYALKNKFKKEKNTYLLCSSAYAAKDYKILGKYKDKSYKWGYFPKFIEYDIGNLLNKKEKDIVKILWAGRFIDWKHSEFAVYLAEYLIGKKITNFEISMLGNGELLEQIKNRIKSKHLEKYVKVLGAVPSDVVRKYMEDSNIYIFTSDQNEGWGAVLNESMNSACAVVANKKIGSVPYLIKHNVNGLCYNTKNEFFHQVEKLIRDKSFRIEISKNAYLTIKNTWNAEIAASNLLKLYESLNSNVGIERIKEGPCSKDIDYL